jgi:hypothetical protein
MKQAEAFRQKGEQETVSAKVGFPENRLSANKNELSVFRQSFPAAPKNSFYARRVTERRASLFRMEIFVGTYMRPW